MIFLRPWLLLLIFVPILLRLFRRHTGYRTPWAKVIDKRLLPYLLTGNNTVSTRRRSWYELLVWTLISVAAAGPAWNKTTVPTRTQQPGTVIIAELSPAMTGESLKQAQLKIYDILNQLKGEQVGLVVYDNIGYTASPLTPDTDIIRGLVPALDPTILPETGARADAGFKQADKLFKNAGLNTGRIVFLTTGAFDKQELRSATQKLPYRIGILGIGNGEEKPVPLPRGGFLNDSQGQPILTRLDNTDLSSIGAFTKATPDDTDVRYLLRQTEGGNGGQGQQNEAVATVWHDRGVYVVLLCLPLFAFLFRRGVYFIFILAFWILPASAGFWQRPDQEAYTRQMAGVNAYRAQQYEVAESLFQTGKTDDDFYNRGNALAFQNKIDEAIAAYDQVLKRNPDHADAQYNKAYLEKQKQEQEQQQKQNQSKQEPDKQNGSGSSDQQEEEQNQAAPNNPTHADKQSESENATAPESETGNPQPSSEQNTQTESENQSENGQTEPKNLTETQDDAQQRETSIGQQKEPFDQESEQILNRLRQDPSRVLRYRIYQQYQRHQGG